MKVHLFAIAFVSFWSLQSSANFLGPAKLSNNVNLSPIARLEDGSVIRTGLDKAVEYCNSIGQRLPTPLEWALHAVDLGAVGISETRLEDYAPIYHVPFVQNPSVVFYFNSNGYQPDEDDMLGRTFWTSHPIWGAVVATSFYAATRMDAHFSQQTIRNSKLAIRCI